MVVVVAMFLPAISLPAHDQIPGEAQSRPIVIRDGTIHTVDGQTLSAGSVLFDAGRIVSVGKDLKIPAGTQVIDAKGMHVYPGLIESISDIGLREISAVEETSDRNEFGNENPNAQAWVAVNPDSELIPVARANGVLTAMTAPRGSWIRGQTAVINLDGWSIREMTIRVPAGLFVDWSAMHPRDDDPKKRGDKREAKLKELDELFDEVRRYRDLRNASPDSAGTDLRLESLIDVVEGKLPLIADADWQYEIESAVTYAQSQALKLVICGGYDAERCSELLKKFEIPVIIASTYRLPKRRDDPFDASYTLPARLQRLGVKFCLAGSGAGGPGGAAATRNLPYHAAVAAAYGLTSDQALRAITLSAAEVLGVDESIGSITPGKDATLFVATGDILQTETQVTHAFIRGRVVDLGSRHRTLYEKYRLKYSRAAQAPAQ